MSYGTRTWKAIASRVKVGARSVKKVKSSGYQNMFAIATEQAGEEKTCISFKSKGLWHNQLTYNDTVYDFFDTIDSGYMQVVGAPRVAQEGIFVAIPENAEVKDVIVVKKKEKPLPGTFNLLPAPKPFLESEQAEYIPDPTIYDSDEVFPAKDFELMGTKHIDGKKVVHLLVYLFHCQPKSQQVIALESLDLNIIYETKPGMESTPKRRTLSKSIIDQLILDSDNTLTADEMELFGAAGVGAVGVDDGADYVIITTADLKNSFTEFVAIKSAQYKVKMITLEEIRALFPGLAPDVAIQKYLKDAVEKWRIPPKWLVLGGNIDKIPTRGAAWPLNFPSDHYYADLTGDFCPDISVSRFPASTPAEMKEICTIAANYSRHDVHRRNNRVLFTADDTEDAFIKCSCDIVEMIKSKFNVIEKYAGIAAKNQVINEINNGVDLINYRGHGLADRWRASNGLDNSDIPNLTNGNMLPQILNICCSNNALDNPTPCFGATWIKEKKAITFLGASRESDRTSNNLFGNYLWDGIINNGLSKAGEIFNWATTKLYRSNPSDYVIHNIYLYLLLGDPTADFKITT